MKLGIIGIGNVGSILLDLLSNSEFTISISARTLEHAKKVSSLYGENVQAMSVEDTINNSDVLIFATMFEVTKTLMKEYKDNLSKKIIIDTSNPIQVSINGIEKIVPENHSSVDQLIKILNKDTVLVKSYTTLMAEQLHSYANSPIKYVMFYTTDSLESIDVIEKIISETGYKPIRIGNLERSIEIEFFGQYNASNLKEAFTESNIELSLLKK